jgi:glycerophosphoryl diester phosphodiesterase
VELIAHRGNPFEALENSLAAFECAIREGATRLELDVWMGADGTPLVCHDPRTGRVSPTDLDLRTAAASEIASLRLRDGSALPTLEAVCHLVSGRAALDIELKDPRPDAACVALEVARRSGAVRDAWFTSFEEAPLAALRDAGFGGPTGLLIGSRSMSLIQRLYEAWPLAALERVGATALAVHHRLAHTVLRSRLRLSGYQLWLWMSVEDEEKPPSQRAAAYAAAARTGADALIVGRVAEARHALDRDGLLSG